MSGNENIEAIYLTDIDEKRLSVFSTLPNLRYLQISSSKQEIFPDISVLKSLNVLILANLTRVPSLDFISGMTNLKTLYVYGMNRLADLSALAELRSLRELSLHHGRMTGTGNPVKSMEPLAVLTQLRYLEFILRVDGKKYDLTPLFGLKELEYLWLMRRYLEQRQWTCLREHLPQLNKEWANAGL